MLTAGFVLVASMGCEAMGGRGAQRAKEAPLEPNIIKVIAYWGQSPFGPVGGGSKPGGFVIGALYLVAPTEKGGERGVFGDGIIHVSMFAFEPDAEGKPQRRLAREWLFDPEQAKPYRTKKPYLAGYGYQLHCPWGDADVLGKKVEIEIRFERRDGRVVQSRPRSFVVPKA